jgi:hypothetical protein
VRLKRSDSFESLPPVPPFSVGTKSRRSCVIFIHCPGMPQRGDFFLTHYQFRLLGTGAFLLRASVFSLFFCWPFFSAEVRQRQKGWASDHDPESSGLGSGKGRKKGRFQCLKQHQAYLQTSVKKGRFFAPLSSKESGKRRFTAHH